MKWVLAIAMVTGLPASAARPPDFSARYENPIYAGNGERGGEFDNYGARWFDFWKDGTGFAHSPYATEAKNCLNEALYFCIHLAESMFAVPPRGIRPGATWWATEDNDTRFRLIAIAKVRFRGKDIEIHSIKGGRRISAQRQGLPRERVLLQLRVRRHWLRRHHDRDVPPRRRALSGQSLEAVSALISQHGLGGRENCKYWKCGSPSAIGK